MTCQIQKGSPPHTRGILLYQWFSEYNNRFTPAYAGNTHGDVLLHALLKVHPRIRGEYAWLRMPHASLWGSPPHTRGILASQQVDVPEQGFTPAYAGNTAKG